MDSGVRWIPRIAMYPGMVVLTELSVFAEIREVTLRTQTILTSNIFIKCFQSISM